MKSISSTTHANTFAQIKKQANKLIQKQANLYYPHMLKAYSKLKKRKGTLTIKNELALQCDCDK